MQRRHVLGLIAAGLAAVSLPVLAQQARRVRRIGYLSGTNVQTDVGRQAAFRAGMAELGWIEGRDYAIDARYANGVAQARGGLAAELVATQPDVLLAAGDSGVRVLAQSTKTIPIVFVTASDPVGLGFAASLQRPSGNVTGLTSLARELGPKRLQLLKEAFPRVERVVLLLETDNINSLTQMKEVEAAAPRLNMRVTPIELRQAADIEPALKRGAALGAHAYVLTQSPFANTRRQEIVDRILRSKLPAMYPSSEFAEAGGLMSYGPSYHGNYHREAAYVDKILKGAKPGDLPIEQPLKFELVINLKTAKALGIKIPQSILVRADRVIE